MQDLPVDNKNGLFGRLVADCRARFARSLIHGVYVPSGEAKKYNGFSPTINGEADEP